MKKVFALLTGFVFVGLVACGPSANEKETQRLADSAAAAQNAAAADSLLQQANAASTDTVAAPADTTAHAAH